MLWICIYNLSMYLSIHDIEMGARWAAWLLPWSPPLSSQEASTKTTFRSVDLHRKMLRCQESPCYHGENIYTYIYVYVYIYIYVYIYSIIYHNRTRIQESSQNMLKLWGNKKRIMTHGAKNVRYQLPGPKPSDSGSASADATVALQPETWWRSWGLWWETNLMPFPLDLKANLSGLVYQGMNVKVQRGYTSILMLPLTFSLL